MTINLSEIMSVKDKVEHKAVPIELDDITLDGMNYSFLKKEPVSLTVTNRNKRKVLIQGETAISLGIPCSRCLDLVEVPFDISVSREIDFSETRDERIQNLDELRFLEGYQLDVDMLLYEEILVNFPMKIVCDESCKGICNVCGTNQNTSSCDCESTALDPRMSIIRDIFNNFKEV